MTIDLDLYRHTVKPLLVAALRNHPERPITDNISEVARGSYCPIIAVTCYAMEIVGKTVDLNNFLDSLKVFYRPDDIIGYLIRGEATG